MKNNSFQPSLLIAVLIILIPASTFAISSTKNNCMHPTTDNSLLYNPSLFSIMDTLDPNKLSFNDRKSQAKAIRMVKHEYHIASKEERKKTKKDNFGVVLAILAVIPFVLFAFLGYGACKSAD